GGAQDSEELFRRGGEGNVLQRDHFPAAPLLIALARAIDYHLHVGTFTWAPSRGHFHAGTFTRRSSWGGGHGADAAARRRKRWSLPVDVLGSASTKSSQRGALYPASRRGTG